MQIAWGYLLGLFFGMGVGLAIGSVIGAVLLHAAGSCFDEDFSFGQAYAAFFFGRGATFFIAFIMGFVMALAGAERSTIEKGSALIIPIGFLIESAIMSTVLFTTFGRTVLLQLATVGIAICIAFPIVLTLILVGVIAT